MSISGAKPKVGYRFYFRNKCHNRMPGFATGLVFIVAFGAALPIAIACHYRRIYVRRKVVKLQTVEKPAVKSSENLMGNGNVKLAKIALKCLVLRHSFPAVQALKTRIKAGDVHVGETLGPTPYTAHKQ
jgi:hypothetical protein